MQSMVNDLVPRYCKGFQSSKQWRQVLIHEYQQVSWLDRQLFIIFEGIEMKGFSKVK